MEEIWKDVPNYEGLYEASTFGRLRNSKNKKILKGTPDKSGYIVIGIRKNYKSYYYRLHQLIAITFLNHVPNGHNLVVNHRDFNRQNNSLVNLEIISQRENTNQKHRESSSIFTGVCWYKKLSKWKASITINGTKKHLGYFEDELEASMAYLKAYEQLIIKD